MGEDSAKQLKSIEGQIQMALHEIDNAGCLYTRAKANHDLDVVSKPWQLHCHV